MVATRSQARAAAAVSAASDVAPSAAEIWADTNTRLLSLAKQSAEEAPPLTQSESPATAPGPSRRKAAPKQKAATGKTKTTTAKDKGKAADLDVTPLQNVAGQSKTITDLPPEIRNDIWTMAVVQDSFIPVAIERPFLKEPALLAVDRQIRSETMSIWYAEHSFLIDGSSPAVKFLRSRNDQQLRSIRWLCISSEKSEQMRTQPRAWVDHLRKKTETFMREFESRGFRKKALNYQVVSGGELKWIDGENMEVCEVMGNADKGKRIRGGPRKGTKVPGRTSQPTVE